MGLSRSAVQKTPSVDVAWPKRVPAPVPLEPSYQRWKMANWLS